MQLGQRYEKVNPWEDFYQKTFDHYAPLNSKSWDLKLHE